MRYLAAIFLPPLACLLCGRLIGTLANAALYVVAWVLLFAAPPLGFLAWLFCALHGLACAEACNRKERRHEINLMLAAQGHQPLPEERPFLSGMRGAAVAVVAVIGTIAAVFIYGQRNPEGLQSFGDGWERKTRELEAFSERMEKRPAKTPPVTVLEAPVAADPVDPAAVEEQNQSIDQTGVKIHRLLEARAAMEGKTFAEITATHGAPQSKDAATGWATWPKFKAQFQGGKVVTVDVTP